MEHTLRTVGVLDKSVAVLNAVGDGPCSLAVLVERTGISRATAHRLATALEDHGLLRRTGGGRFALGLHLVALGRAATEQFPLAEAARTAMEDLRTATGESVQLYVVNGGSRVCVTALESPHGLRTIVPVGAALPLDRGSAGRVLTGEVGRHGWVETVEEREPGVASVSAPVVGPDRGVVAAVSVSGPIDRMGRAPGRKLGDAVVAAALAIEGARTLSR